MGLMYDLPSLPPCKVLLRCGSERHSDGIRCNDCMAGHLAVWRADLRRQSVSGSWGNAPALLLWVATQWLHLVPRCGVWG